MFFLSSISRQAHIIKIPCLLSLPMFVLHAVSSPENTDTTLGTICCKPQSYWTKRHRTDSIVKSWQSASAVCQLCSDGFIPRIDVHVSNNTDSFSIQQNETRLDNSGKVVPVVQSYTSTASTAGDMNANTVDDGMLNFDTGTDSNSDVDESCDSFIDNFTNGNDSDSSCSEENELCKELADWAVEYRVASVAIDKLLKILHTSHLRLPLHYFRLENQIVK